MPPRKPVPAPVKCRATSRQTGKRCGQWAIPGSTACKWHGGLGGRNGRAAAEELHAVRRIEAVVTEAASQAMLAAGWPAEAVEAAGGQLPRMRPDDESTPSADLITDEDEDNAINRSMARLVQTLTREFQELAAAQAAAQAQAATSRPATIEGQVVTPEPDPVAERIEALEARPTRKRMAEAARLRQPREHSGQVLTLHGQAADPEPDPPAAPVPEPRPAKPGRRTTTLGTRPDGTINTGGNLR